MTTHRAARSSAGDVLHPIVRRVVIFLAFVSAAATIGALLWGPRLTMPEAGMRDSYGGGPLGHRAFAEVLEGLGIHVLQSRGARFEAPSAPLVFIEPAKETRVDGRNRLLRDAIGARVTAGRPTVLVLPKWNLSLGAVTPTALPDPGTEIQEILDAALAPDELYEKRQALHLGTDLGGRYLLGGLLGEFEAELPRIQAITEVPASATVLLDSEVGAVVVEHGSLIVVSDPDLLHNFNLHRADHARLWQQLFERLGADSVVIDEAFHGHGHTFSLREVAGQFPALLIIVHGVLFVVLLVLLGSKRFGAPDTAREAEHGPREAIAVAAAVLAEGQPLPVLAYHYLTAVIVDMHSRLGLPEQGGLPEQAARLDVYAEQRDIPGVMRQLLAEASTGADRPKSWAMVRRAFEFRERVLGHSATPREIPLEKAS